MSSCVEDSDYESRKSLKRKRSLDKTDGDFESPMQPRRRLKKPDENTTSDNEVVLSREWRKERSSPESGSAFASKNDGFSPAFRERLSGKWRDSPGTSTERSSYNTKTIRGRLSWRERDSSKTSTERYSSDNKAFRERLSGKDRDTPRTSTDRSSFDAKRRDSQKKPWLTFTPKNYSPSASRGSYSTPRKEKDSPTTHRGAHSSPRKGNKSPDASASPWVADFLRTSEEGSSTPRTHPRITFTKDSNGPLLHSYQLLGDSLLVRFADQILHERAVIGENGKFTNGHCVGGQTIEGLIQKVDGAKRPLESKVIVLIGTNDFLKGTAPTEVKNWMRRLMDMLQKKIETIVVLTVPPIPRLSQEPSHWENWEQYNDWIRSLDNGSTVRVVDAAALYLNKPRDPDMSAYESFMGHGRRKRVDHIHLNRLGLKRLNQEVCKQISKFGDAEDKQKIHRVKEELE